MAREDRGESGDIELTALGAAGDMLATVHPDPRQYLAPDMNLASPVALAGSSVVAVLDTGVLPDHPWIKSRLRQPPLDVTGLGPVDEHGHGTVVALLLIAAAPNIELVSVRVLDREGKGPFTALLRGMQAALVAGADMLNISIGRYDPDCRGDCPVCHAASNVAAAGPLVVAAAGNLPGQTSCPAKAGLFKDRSIAVSEWDPVRKSVSWSSGVGTTAAVNAAERFDYRWRLLDAHDR